jgi:hypothetical protein
MLLHFGCASRDLLIGSQRRACLDGYLLMVLLQRSSPLHLPLAGPKPPMESLGTMSVPYRTGSPTYKVQVETRGRVCIHTLPHVLQLQTIPPWLGGIWCCHVAHGFRPCLHTQEGSSIATSPVAPDLTPPQWWAPLLSHGTFLRTPDHRARWFRC